MRVPNAEIIGPVVTTLRDFSSNREIHLDQWLFRDLGVSRSEGVNLVYALEEKLDVDLHGLIDAERFYFLPLWLDRLIRRNRNRPFPDMTVDDLVHHIASCSGASSA